MRIERRRDPANQTAGPARWLGKPKDTAGLWAFLPAFLGSDKQTSAGFARQGGTPRPLPLIDARRLPHPTERESVIFRYYHAEPPSNSTENGPSVWRRWPRTGVNKTEVSAADELRASKD